VSYWGSFFGGGSDAVGALWVRINRDVPVIGAIGDVLELLHTRWVSIAQSIESAFDLRTAIGYSLDLWGEVLGQKRLGLSDADYRRLLLAQAQIILTGTSTRAKMIAVYTAWVGAAPVEYRDTGRTVEIGGEIPSAYEARLLRLMARVRPAARRVRVYHITDDDLVADYGLDPTGTTTITDYGLDPVTDPAPTAEPVH
jgi:hypothetical protein